MLQRRQNPICAYCKGVRGLCGAKVCPILLKQTLNFRMPRYSKKSIDGHSINVLVGEYNYPNVRFGPISSFNVISGDPEEWAKKRLDFSDILKTRIWTIYAFKRNLIKRVPQIDDPLGQITISYKPVNVEVRLKKEPRFRIHLDPQIPPFGASSILEKIFIEDNIYAPRKVENAVEEDVKAAIIVPELYKHGISYYYLQRLLSAGLLGRKFRRKLVPTRWSITATDSILSEFFIKSIRYAKEIEDAGLYFWEYLGNKYYIILIPNRFWSMEMFEIWLPKSVWLPKYSRPVVIRIYEDYTGKPNKMDGGYYAIKKSILEFLYKRRRKAVALAIRIITPNYIAPVGSWQIRESVKLALENGPVIKSEYKYLIRLMLEKEPILEQIRMMQSSWLLKRLAIKSLDSFLASR